MQGFLCERKATDTHGLPVEVEVCKELGIHSKEEIEEYGVEPFIHRCQESVWRYMQEWEALTERLGFWVNLDDATSPINRSSRVFGGRSKIFSTVACRIAGIRLSGGGHKVAPPAAGEVADTEVADPSVFVEFPLVGSEQESLLVWTTTPWTLPSNQFAAVHEELRYAKVRDSETGRILIVAESLVECLLGNSRESDGRVHPPRVRFGWTGI